ncbi:MAG: DUF882 domain-containing protein [Methylocystis sp.]|nr:DUF882 domain-containing protein [Methylocystis sp.]
MPNPRERRSRKKLASPSRLAGALTIFLTALAPSLTETAAANGETRTIYLYHTHTHEQIAATYLVDGHYDQAVLQKLNWFLRDWRSDEQTNMDARLFDVVWEAYRSAGATDPINIVSAYRSPTTNAMLRRRSRGVAKSSQHMLGKAMDTTMPSMPMARIREIGMRMQRGGVGYYPSSGLPFVHLDVGRVRSWPRMTYDQLVRLFPDGKTVHLPTNGQPLARYEEARAEIEARGNGSYVAPVERKSGTLLAFLFGGGEEDEDSGLVGPASSAHKQWASLAPRDSRSARSAAAEDGGRSEAIARAESNLPRGETALGQGPTGADAQKPTAPEKAVAVNAPLEPADGDANVTQTGAPLPPRRPANLTAVAMTAPLPPVRPVEFASLAAAPAIAAAPAGAAATVVAIPPAAPQENGARAVSAIASLIDATGTTPARPGAGQIVPAVLVSPETPTSNGERPPKEAQPLLAYAPAPEASRQGLGEGPIGLRASASVRRDAPKPAAQRAAFVPARLDHTNFGTMIETAPASQAASGSILGSAIGASRSAARAQPGILGAAPATTFLGAFASRVRAPPTDRFAHATGDARTP